MQFLVPDGEGNQRENSVCPRAPSHPGPPALTQTPAGLQDLLAPPPHATSTEAGQGLDGKCWKGEEGYLPGLGIWLAPLCRVQPPPAPPKINIPRRSGSKIDPYQMGPALPGP